MKLFPSFTKKTFTIPAALFSCCSTLFLLPTTATAATWNGSDGHWDTGTSWDTGNVPGAGEDVFINSGSVTVSNGQGQLFRNGTGNTTIAGGDLFIAGGSSPRLALTGGGGAFSISSGRLMVSGEYFIVANGSKSGIASQTGGTVTATLSRGFLFGDQVANAGSAYKMSGGTLTITSTGTSLPNDDANNEGLRGVWLGIRTASTSGDFFELSGDATAHFQYTHADRKGRGYISNGSHISLADSATLTIDGYTSVDIGGFTDGDTVDPNKTSKILVSGGDLTITNSVLNVGKDARGQLIIDEGTVTVDTLALNSNGIIELTSGELFISNTLSLAGGTLDYRGGTLKINGDYSDLLTQEWFNDLSGGAIVSFDGTFTTIVPEPSTYATLGVAVFSLALFARRKKRAHKAS